MEDCVPAPEVINRATLECLPPAWNKGVEDRIAAAYGPEVTNEVKELYEYAVRRPIGPGRPTTATARVAEEIGEAYPFLTAKAVERLARCFWYVWRWALKKTDARVSAQRLCYKGAHGPGHVDGSSGPCPSVEPAPGARH
jgi:hypothetical protein